ncbi:MAG: glutathione S-transferase N-terminal domain-containing protein [Myxococcota bacterium]
MTMELWTTATPNGWKISIMIEELHEAGIELPGFSVRTINIMKGEQFTAEFTAANPNQKIPVLIDDGRPIMESGAILQYLGEKFPNAGLLPEGPARWDVLQWLYWQVANVGPVFGNKLSYTRYMPDVEDLKKSHPLERFGKEARRLSGVLDDQLEGRDYVCGQFSIADIALYPWIRGWKWSKVDITDRPNVMAWVERVRARPGVGRGLAYGVPKEEVDQWSADTKARYARGGATMASNDD